MNDTATDPARFADRNDAPDAPDAEDPSRFTFDEQTAGDRIVLPEQSAIIFSIRETDDPDVSMVDVKVVFADGTRPDEVPMVSNIAARATTLVTAMLRGEIPMALLTDPTAPDEG